MMLGKDFDRKLKSFTFYVDGLIVLFSWRNLTSGVTIIGWQNS